jgi:rRNA maturation protein Nop10
MAKIEWCPNCDNVTHLKRKCKVCGGEGVVLKGKSGISQLKHKKK